MGRNKMAPRMFFVKRSKPWKRKMKIGTAQSEGSQQKMMKMRGNIRGREVKRTLSIPEMKAQRTFPKRKGKRRKRWLVTKNRVMMRGKLKVKEKAKRPRNLKSQRKL